MAKMPRRRSLRSRRDFRDPKEYFNLFENELESDVTLLVGEEEGWQERVPAHSWVLAGGSEYFRALLQGPCSHSEKKVHHFLDNPKGFNNLIRWLYQNKCDLQTVQSSLDTLSVAIKYLCPELAENCIMKLTTQINVINALRILSWIYFYCTSYQIPSPPPSAPSIEDLDNTNYSSDDSSNVSNSSRDPTLSCHILLNECLDLIDKNSDQVLGSEHLIGIDIPVLQIVLKRDTLNLSSELKVLEALNRWALARCKMERIPLTLENKRKVLGPHLYLARLLAFTETELDDLMANHDKFSLLTEQELLYVNNYIRNPSYAQAVPETMAPYLDQMSKPRNLNKVQAIELQDLSHKDVKRKRKFKKRFNKKEILLDFVAVLGAIFD